MHALSKLDGDQYLHAFKAQFNIALCWQAMLIDPTIEPRWSNSESERVITTIIAGDDVKD